MSVRFRPTLPKKNTMKVSEMIENLQRLQEHHGDLEVMFNSTEDDAIWEIIDVNHTIVSEDIYPEDWHMPVGFEYIELIN